MSKTPVIAWLMHNSTTTLSRLLFLSLCLAAPVLAQQQPPASVVQVANVSRAELAPTVAVPGTIYSRNDVQITAGVPGQLQIVKEPGTFVDKGDIIAQIDNRTLLLQRAEINVR
jgi:multidrug efflux pump subunit AcrA (membrane-fusion protein)